MKRWTAILPALVFLVCFGVYTSTLNPAFRADDSPETIAACVTLGIQHPPAYPLHTLIGNIFSRLPAGAPAFRLNLMAALFGALTCALVAAGLQTWLLAEAASASEAAAAGAVGGLVLGFSKTFWAQSLAAKGGIYTLHSAFMAALLLCLIHWSCNVFPEEAFKESLNRRLRSRCFLLSILLFTLGFGNHWETQALLVPPTLLFSFLFLGKPWGWPFKNSGTAQQPRTELRNPGKPSAMSASNFPGSPLTWALVLALLGLSIYAYLPLRARQDPFLDWGDPRDWSQFWWVFQRQEYLDLEVGFLKSLRAAIFSAGPWADVSQNWSFIQRQGLRVLGHFMGPNSDLGWPALLLALAGAWSLIKESLGSGGRAWNGRRRRALTAWLFTLGAGILFVVTFYFHLKPEMVWILDVFLIPAYLVQAVLAGLGTYILWKCLGHKNTWFLAMVPIYLGLSLYYANAGATSQVRHFLAWDYGKDLLLSAKPKAVILAEGDFNTMPIYYLQQVDHERQDLDHVTTVFLSTDWGVAHARTVQPRLGLGELPRAITGARAGDGQVLRAALSQIAQRAQSLKRPIQTAWFRQVQADTVPEWEGRFRPSGLLTELDGPLTPAEDRRRLGLLKAFRTRHLEFDRFHLEPSPEFALSNYGTAYLELANSLRSRGYFDLARPLYKRAEVVGSRSNLAEILIHEGIAVASGGPAGHPAPDLVAAANLFRQALLVKPIFEGYVNLAGICNQLGQKTKQASYFLEAEAAARQAVGLAPTSAQAWNNLAVAQYYQNRQEEARQTLRQALQLAPGDSQILANLRALGG